MPIRHYRALNHEHCRAEIMIPLPSSRLRHYQSSTELTQNDSQVRLRRCASPTFGAVPYCEAPECHLRQRGRSEEHTSELQSLMRISYAVFCLKKKPKYVNNKPNTKQLLATTEQNKQLVVRPQPL